MKEYLKFAWELEKIREDKEVLDETAQLEEYVFLGMRKMEGIQLKQELLDCYGENIERMKKQNLVKVENGQLKLTREGIDVSNYVFSEILF